MAASSLSRLEAFDHASHEREAKSAALACTRSDFNTSKGELIARGEEGRGSLASKDATDRRASSKRRAEMVLCSAARRSKRDRDTREDKICAHGEAEIELEVPSRSICPCDAWISSCRLISQMYCICRQYSRSSHAKTLEPSER